MKILTEFKTALPLGNADAVKIIFPTESGEPLEKNIINILDADKGLIEVELSDFEKQSLIVGQEQSFNAKILMDGHEWSVSFPKKLNVGMIDGRKEIL